MLISKGDFQGGCFPRVILGTLKKEWPEKTGEWKEAAAVWGAVSKGKDLQGGFSTFPTLHWKVQIIVLALKERGQGAIYPDHQ